MPDTTTTPDVPGEVLPSYARQKRWTILAMFAFIITMSVVDAVAATDPASLLSRVLALVIPCGMSLGVLIWCSFDSLERGEQLGRGMQVLIVLIAVVGVSLYFLRTRGVPRAFRSLAKAGGLFLLMLLAALLALLLASLLLDLPLQT